MTCIFTMLKTKKKKFFKCLVEKQQGLQWATNIYINHIIIKINLLYIINITLNLIILDKKYKIYNIIIIRLSYSNMW